MKNLISSIFLAVSVLSMSAFAPNGSSDFKVDPAKSTLKWTGKKVTGEHTGNIKIKQGLLKTDGKSLKGGSFVIDMTTITNTDLTDKGYNEKLVGHLNSDDFFGVAKHKEAKLNITSVTSKGSNNYDVKGNLTIKGITQPVEFPATVIINKGNIKANASISVDRTKYDIKYGSGSFFDNLGDKAIDNVFVIDVELVANK
jgi:polyisoprenoid-binding protein YceI